MLYYKVKPEFDNVVIDKKFNILIGNELYTPKEFEKIKSNYHKNKDNLNKMVDAINVSKRKIYWCFGARFTKWKTTF